MGHQKFPINYKEEWDFPPEILSIFEFDLNMSGQTKPKATNTNSNAITNLQNFN